MPLHAAVAARARRRLGWWRGRDGAPAARMVVQAAGASDAGRRRAVNQDYFAIIELGGETGTAAPPAGDRAVAPPGVVVLVVADGVGGGSAGEVASEMAANVIHFHLACAHRDQVDRLVADPAGCLRNAIEAANGAIRERAAVQGPAGMATTATAAVIVGGAVHVGHVGDSRAYLIRAAAAEQLTRDHSLAEHLRETGAVPDDWEPDAEQRRVLVQALGAQPSVEVALASRALGPGDLVLLCTDGLWTHVEPAELGDLAAAEADLAAAAARLVATANDRGGEDNVTVVLARVDEEAGE